MLNNSSIPVPKPPSPTLYKKKDAIPLKRKRGACPNRKRAACPVRKRGGQPGNRNAFSHGLYSSHSPHPQADLFNSVVPRVLGSKIKEGNIALIPALKKTLAGYDDLLRNVYVTLKRAKSTRELCAWADLFFKISRVCTKLEFALLKLGSPPVHLFRLARSASLLVQREFEELGIREWLIFVPQELNNLRANLGSGGPILTDHQWLLICPAFDTIQHDLYYYRKYKSHKPRPAHRLLFEAILIKLAFGISWHDLPRAFSVRHPQTRRLPDAIGYDGDTSRRRNFTPFPLRACQRLYRDLFNSGRLQAIYKGLQLHLHAYGEVTLQELVEGGCFFFDNKRVYLVPGMKLNWQRFTALLLLQRAYHNLRALQRDQVADRRRRGKFLRFHSPHQPRRLPVAIGYVSDTSRRHPPPPPGINDVVDFEPLNRKTANKEFQKLALLEREISMRLRSSKTNDLHSPPLQE